jgi:hypothetical protein
MQQCCKTSAKMLSEREISTHLRADSWDEWKSRSLNRRMGWWFIEFVTWDGLLPLAVAACPWAIKTLFPRNDIAGVFAAIFIPMAAALLRSVTGAKQIRRNCAGELPVGRQVALAVAISFLLMFEIGASCLILAGGDPTSWAYVFCFFACYLVAAALAFIPRRTSNFGRALRRPKLTP